VLQREVETLLSEDAKSLGTHIQARCPDLHSVDVIPTVSFAPTFERAALSFARHPGERGGLERSGLGMRQRVSLATWEWTSELLASDASEQVDADKDEPALRQTIIVYDEPDTHLDYGQQRKIMDLIRSQGEIPSTNVIVATNLRSSSPTRSGPRWPTM